MSPRNDYTPRPHDTSHVELDPSIVALVERLAANTHDVWARGRIAEGWRVGPKRDDARREHPGLVPYDELSDSEKDYDRATALETIRAILALGFRISGPASSDAVEAALEGRRHVPSTTMSRELITTIRSADAQSLFALWTSRPEHAWRAHRELYVAAAERLLQLGYPLNALEVVVDAAATWPHDAKLIQQRALALASSGRTLAARDVLSPLAARAEHEADPEETLGIFGRIEKDLALAATDARERETHLAAARDAYRRAFAVTRGYYAGINAATLMLLLGDAGGARTLASEVRALCLAELQRLRASGDSPYYATATLAEAYLLLGEYEEATEWYGRAANVGRRRVRDLASTRRNARLVLEALGRDRTLVDGVLRIPRVALFAGVPRGRTRRGWRVAPRAEEAVTRAIDRALARADAAVGFASASAVAGDLLFIDALAARGGDVHIVLPYGRQEFIEDDLAIAGREWRGRHEEALKRAVDVTEATERRPSASAALHEYAEMLLLGLALGHARALETEVVPMMLGLPDEPPRSEVALMADLGLPIEVIVIEPEAATTALVARVPVGRRGRSGTGMPRRRDPSRVMGVLFADVVNFSRVEDPQIPLFVKHVLGMVGALANESPHAPVVRNTWGDGLYFLFEHVRDAGLFALELSERMDTSRAEWSRLGLPENLALRTGLHAGPLFPFVDPVTRQRSWTGKHVVRAARIEPVTPAGTIYTSREFAALAEAHRVRDFTCVPVGRIGLAKRSATVPLFELRRSA